MLPTNLQLPPYWQHSSQSTCLLSFYFKFSHLFSAYLFYYRIWKLKLLSKLSFPFIFYLTNFYFNVIKYFKHIFMRCIHLTFNYYSYFNSLNKNFVTSFYILHSNVFFATWQHFSFASISKILFQTFLHYYVNLKI